MNAQPKIVDIIDIADKKELLRLKFFMYEAGIVETCQKYLQCHCGKSRVVGIPCEHELAVFLKL